MSEAKVGTVGWFDLTVGDAVGLRDFYAAVVGWRPEPLAMGDYDDFVMKSSAGDAVAGICHARGANAKLPPQWLMYVTVTDVDASAKRAAELGGVVLDGPRALGGGRFAAIRDPAGAVIALYQE